MLSAEWWWRWKSDNVGTLAFDIALRCCVDVLHLAVLLSLLCFLPFGALLGTGKNLNPISVKWKEMNTIGMHRIKRALLQNFAWLPFAVAPHPLAFDALSPPPSFCPPPLVRCAPGDMQKTKSYLRQLERNEHDMYAQNQESVTAELCMVTFCCCSSSTCFQRFAASAFFLSASSRSVRSWRHAKDKIRSPSIGKK